MRRIVFYIFSIILNFILSVAPGYSQNLLEDNYDPGTLYIFNNDSVNFWQEGTSWTLSFSDVDTLGNEYDHPVRMIFSGGEVLEPFDYDIQDVDSIQLYEAASSIKPGVIELDRSYFPYVLAKTLTSITFSNSMIGHIRVPQVGDKLVSRLYEYPLQNGFCGEVISVEYRGDSIHFECRNDITKIGDYYENVAFSRDFISDKEALENIAMGFKSGRVSMREEWSLKPAKVRAAYKDLEKPKVHSFFDSPISIPNPFKGSTFTTASVGDFSYGLRKTTASVDLGYREDVFSNSIISLGVFGLIADLQLQTEMSFKGTGSLPVPTPLGVGIPKSPIPISGRIGLVLEPSGSMHIVWGMNVNACVGLRPGLATPYYLGASNPSQSMIYFPSDGVLEIDGEVAVPFGLSVSVGSVSLSDGGTQDEYGETSGATDFKIEAELSIGVSIKGKIGIVTAWNDEPTVTNYRDNYNTHKDMGWQAGWFYKVKPFIPDKFNRLFGRTYYPYFEKDDIQLKLMSTTSQAQNYDLAFHTQTQGIYDCDYGFGIYDIRSNKTNKWDFTETKAVEGDLFPGGELSANLNTNISLLKGGLYRLYPLFMNWADGNKTQRHYSAAELYQQIEVPYQINTHPVESNIVASLEADIDPEVQRQMNENVRYVRPYFQMVKFDEPWDHATNLIPYDSYENNVIKKTVSIEYLTKYKARAVLVFKDGLNPLSPALSGDDEEWIQFGNTVSFTTLSPWTPVTKPDPTFSTIYSNNSPHIVAKLPAWVNPSAQNLTEYQLYYGMYVSDDDGNTGFQNDFFNQDNYDEAGRPLDQDLSSFFDLSQVNTTGNYTFTFNNCEPATKYTYQAVTHLTDYLHNERTKYRAKDGIPFETYNPFLTKAEKIDEDFLDFYAANLEGKFLDARVNLFLQNAETTVRQHRLSRVFFEFLEGPDQFSSNAVHPSSKKFEIEDIAEAVENNYMFVDVDGLKQNTPYSFRLVSVTNWGKTYFSNIETFRTKCIFDSKMVSAVTDKKTDVTTFKATITQPLLDQIKAGTGHKIRFVYCKKNGGSSLRTDFINPTSTNISYTLPRRLDYATDYEVSLEVIPEGIDPDDIASHINGWVYSSNTVSFTTPHPYRMSVPFFADLLDYQDGFTLQFQPSEECERRRLEEGKDIEFLFYLWHGEEYIDPTQDDMKDAVTELYPDSYSDYQHLGFLTYMACYPLQSYGLQPVVRVNGVSYPSEKKDVIYFKTDKPDNWVVKLLPAQMTDVEATLCGQLSPAMKAILEDTEQEYSQLNKPYLRFQYSDNAFNFSDDDWVDVPVERFDGTRFYSTLTLSDGIEARKEYYYRVKLTFESISYEYYDDPLGAKSETFKVDPFKIMNLKATADPYDGTHFTVSAEIGEAGHQMLKTDGQSHFYYFECSEDPEFSDIAAFTGYKDLKDSRMMSGEFDYVDIMTTYYVRCVITGGADGSEDQFIVSDSECKVTTSDIDPGLIIGKPEKGSKPVKKKAVK